MGKKRVEETMTGMEEMENFQLDTTSQPVIPQVQRVPRQVEQPMTVQETRKPEKVEEGPINCLRNERVIIRFVPKETALVKDPKHVLSGGMADNTVGCYVV